MEEIRRIALRDGRFHPEAFRFLYEGLEVAVQAENKAGLEPTQRHVDGRAVLRGLELHARRLFGPLAPAVWRSWGVRSSMDWGRIVFLLVEHEKLSRQESDSIEDFRGYPDIAESLREYRPELASAFAR